MLVEAVVSKPGIGAFDEGILRGLSRLDEVQRRTAAGTPKTIALLVSSVPLSHTRVLGNGRRGLCAVSAQTQNAKGGKKQESHLKSPLPGEVTVREIPYQYTQFPIRGAARNVL